MKKYTAEEAKELILDVATHLFVEKGYEKTSIQDIVKGLDGLSKGAVYHHFDSKHAILYGVARRFIPDEAMLESLTLLDEMSGLEKIQTLLIQTMFNEKRGEVVESAYDLLNDPMFYSLYISMVTDVLSPIIEGFIIQGNQDGSTNAELPRQMAEIIILLISTWFIPALYPNTLETFFDKLTACRIVLNRIGIDVLNDQVMETIFNNLVKKVVD